MISSILHCVKQFVYSFFQYPFDPSLLELTSAPMTIFELERLMKRINELYSDDPELVKNFKLLYDGCLYLNKIAIKYDYNESIQANGFHTYCDLILIMSQAILLMHENDTFNHEHCRNILKLLLSGIKICKELENNDGLFTDKVTFLTLLKLAEELRNELCCIYTHYNSCWLYPCVSKVVQFFSVYMGVYFGHWTNFSLQNCFPTRNRRGELFTSFSLDSNIDASCLKSMWNISEYRLMKFYLSRSIGFYNDIESKQIFIPQETHWQISTFEHETVYETETETEIDSNSSRKSKDHIRCLFFRSKKANIKDRNLLIHIHGGGFISQSPETHAYYLCDWIQNLERKDIAILSIDYTLSPEGPFPVALQEVLDVYLWLISNKPEVNQLLGFKPTNISVCGDSAGGNIATALFLVLSKIRSKRQTIPYPRSLLIFYSPLVLTTSFISPSRLLTSVDGLIPIAPLLNCMRAYVPDDLFPIDTQLPPKYRSFLTQFRNLIFQNCDCEPWFKQTDRLNENMELLNKFLSNPFASPLLTKDYEFTKSIRLYAFGTTYDPFLDDVVEFSKRWLGPKQLFVMPRLPHGFLNLVKLSEKSASTLGKVLEFIDDAFEREE